MRARRRGVSGDCCDKVDDTEFLERGAKVDWRQIAVLKRGQIKIGITRLCQLGLFAQPRYTCRRKNVVEGVSAQTRMIADLAFKSFAVARWLAQPSSRKIINAFKFAAHAHRPVHRTDVERECVGDLVDGLERGAPFAVHFVDEGDDRHAAQAADLEQFASLRLDALCGVYNHDRGVDGGQRAVGVFGKIFMPRCVEQVEDNAVLLKGHHRRCY